MPKFRITRTATLAKIVEARDLAEAMEMTPAIPDVQNNRWDQISYSVPLYHQMPPPPTPKN